MNWKSFTVWILELVAAIEIYKLEFASRLYIDENRVQKDIAPEFVSVILACTDRSKADLPVVQIWRSVSSCQTSFFE